MLGFTGLGLRGRPVAEISVEDRNVRFLMAQTACSGIVNGGITAFLPVLLARMGADVLTISALSAGLALTTIVMALPAGPIVDRQIRLVRWSAKYYYATRAMYGLIAFAVFLPAAWAPFVMVVLWSLHGVPAAIANNAWYSVLAEAVTPRRRPVINGARWALLGLVSAGCMALFGAALDYIPSPYGYQLVFLLSSLGGGLGIWFYSRIVIPDRVLVIAPNQPGLGATIRRMVAPLREGGEFLHYTIGTSVLRVGLHLPVGLYSLFWVAELHASDTFIGLRSTVGNLALTVGYYAWGRLAARLGHRRTLGFAALGMSAYPALTAVSPGVEWLIPAALIWGLFASGIDMSLFEGLLEVCPPARRADFVAVNTFVANVIMFIAPILGAVLAGALGLRQVLLIAALLHLVAVAAVAYLAFSARRASRRRVLPLVE